MTTRDDLDAYTRVLTNALSDEKRGELLDRIAGIDWTQSATVMGHMEDLVVQMGLQHSSVGAQIAAAWYNRLRAAQGFTDGFLAEPRPMTRDEVRAQLRTVTEPIFQNINHAELDAQDRKPKHVNPVSGNTQMRLSQSLRSLVRHLGHNGGRRTIWDAVHADPANPRWARVPTGITTCAFCTMLASRGWVYRSKESAAFKDSRFHSHCDCQIVPSWDKGKITFAHYDPDAYYAIYADGRDAYFTATPPEEWWRDGQTTRGILASMRARSPEKLTDGNWPTKLTDITGSSPDRTLDLRSWETFRRMSALAAYEQSQLSGIPVAAAPRTPPTPPADWPGTLPQLTSKGLAHILYGYTNPAELREDLPVRRGGHQAGYGWWSGGTPFPDAWGERDITAAIRDVLIQQWDGAPGTVAGTVRGTTLLVHVRDAERPGTFTVGAAHPIA